MITTALGTTVPMKQYVDMLWRDARNFTTLDPELPFNRHGNPFEGHSTANGILYNVDPIGRFQERFGEDFHSWMSTDDYARRVIATPALRSPEQANMESLETFAQTNMQLTATGGKLIFQDDSWIYPSPFNLNLTVGQVFDTEVLSTTTTEPGPACLVRNPR